MVSLIRDVKNQREWRNTITDVCQQSHLLMLALLILWGKDFTWNSDSEEESFDVCRLWLFTWFLNAFLIIFFFFILIIFEFDHLIAQKLFFIYCFLMILKVPMPANAWFCDNCHRYLILTIYLYIIISIVMRENKQS